MCVCVWGGGGGWGLKWLTNPPIQSLLVASSTGTDQETLTGLPNGTRDAERSRDRFCSTTATSSVALSYEIRKKL